MSSLPAEPSLLARIDFSQAPALACDELRVECREDDDCVGGELCQLGDCAPPCFGDLDCPIGATCNVGSIDPEGM